jgi:hypothetical protein
MLQDDVSPQLQSYWNHRHSVKGWMSDIDFLLFDQILRMQSRVNSKGNLLEVGAYLGKSAIVIGAHLQSNEEFVICDVFNDHIDDDNSNEDENEISYAGLTRASFEANYRRFLSYRLTIVQELSADICTHVEDGSVRFAHIDGGHQYETVKQDISNARTYMHRDGIVVFDDFRSLHTPGVAAAIWGEIATLDLLPICVSEGKLYATWSQETALSTTESIMAWLAPHPQVQYGRQTIAGQSMMVVANPKIWTLRRRIKTLVPPAIFDLRDTLQPRPKAYFGER